MKADLHRYLQSARDSLVWKLEGLGEYDVRRPMVPTGSNLLGLVKHVASVEIGYFGDTFGRPFPETLPWWEDDAETNADMWATASESREQIVDLYRRAWAHTDETVRSLELDAIGQVPWWPADIRQVTLHHIIVRVIAETNRHAGHADVIRELVDGAIGYSTASPNLPEQDELWWRTYRQRLEDEALAAAAAATPTPTPTKAEATHKAEY